MMITRDAPISVLVAVVIAGFFAVLRLVPGSENPCATGDVKACLAPMNAVMGVNP